MRFGYELFKFENSFEYYGEYVVVTCKSEES